MARDSNAHDFIGSGAMILVIGGALVAALATQLPGDSQWVTWVAAGVVGFAGQVTLLIGVIAKGVQVSRVPLGGSSAAPTSDS